MEEKRGTGKIWITLVLIILIALIWLIYFSGPAAVALPSGALTPGLSKSDEVTLLSATPTSPIVLSGQNVSFNVTSSIHSGSNPTEAIQAFYAYSWSPSWPPSGSYYKTVYNGGPGLAPGVTINTKLTVTAPLLPGVYYVWYLMGSYYTIQDAVNAYKSEPPTSAAQIKLIVI